ncbi:carotenoid oxygenase family protein [Streptomyces sp. NPDC052236]|uniref:carotenoid oxygenase family protein n=1 Tax=Streptomyces sp. NPDC052236 TaxID=3365686 RepID=UPI0037D95C0C
MGRPRRILDPATGRATEESLDSLVTEFPTINEASLGSSNRFTYAIAFPGGGLKEHAIVKYDARTGAPARAGRDPRLVDPGRRRVTTDIDGWTGWNRDIGRTHLTGPLAPGAVFR